MYSLAMLDEICNYRKAKGVAKSYVIRKVRYEQYLCTLWCKCKVVQVLHVPLAEPP